MTVGAPAVRSFRTPWICKVCRSTQVKSTISKRFSSSFRKPKLPEGAARTRFAPSPTGNLHLGSIRTALFSYLIARRTRGQFLLRIEDTDQKRTIPGAEEQLFRDLRWAGIQWDEGPTVGGPYGPYRQSERLEIYREYIEKLLHTGKAYRCFCSAERIDAFNRLRHEKGLPLGYDRKCTHMPHGQAQQRAHDGEAHVVRFHVPNEYPKFTDLVYGKTGHGSDKIKRLQIDEAVYDDPILIKSDGFPTYHFANVVDDQLMRITHVIRGSEWMASTPLHVALYDAFGWNPPAFGHVPLLVDHNRQKLSKRNFDMDITSYKDAGYFPDAVVNFAALLGWSHQRKSDVMDLAELEEIFDLKFTKGNTIVSFDKLTFLQEQHARRKIAAGGEDVEQIIRDVAVALLEQFGASKVSHLVGKRQLRDVIASMLQTESIPFRSADDFVQRASIFLNNFDNRPALEVADPTFLKSFRTASATLCLVPQVSWTQDVHRGNLSMIDMSPNIDDIIAQKRAKKGLYHYLRWALLGGTAGPSIPETMEILGRDICHARIQNAALVTKEKENELTKPTIQRLHTKDDMQI